MNPRRKLFFLLVEDDPSDVFLVRRALCDGHACNIDEVSDGQDAIDYLLHRAPDHDLPDVILLDLKMPRVSGFEFLQWLRSQSSPSLRLIPVIVLSSSDLQEDVQRSYDLGANAFLAKPISAKLFQERLEALGLLWSAHVEIPKAN